MLLESMHKRQDIRIRPATLNHTMEVVRHEAVRKHCAPLLAGSTAGAHPS